MMFPRLAVHAGGTAQTEGEEGEPDQTLATSVGGIDKVAFARFASVYREFEDVDAFRQLIRDI
jgi:transcriptional regulator NrdR family protein